MATPSMGSMQYPLPEAPFVVRQHAELAAMLNRALEAQWPAMLTRLAEWAPGVSLCDDGSRGAMLCETCFDAMTDLVLPATHTATGQEEACCAACWPVGVARG